MAKAKKRVVKKPRKKPVILPMKMSSLIKIALKDLRKVEAQPRKFVVEMGNWFLPEEVICETSSGIIVETHDICSVCAAGSVMAFTLGQKVDLNGDEVCPEHFPKNEKQLHAINELRVGNAIGAARYVGLWEPGPSTGSYRPGEKYQKYDAHIPEYDRDNPEPFHKAMTKFQQKLEKAGL